MLTIFLTSLTNEIVGLIPITLVQSAYILKGSHIFYDQIIIQGILALAFSFGALLMYAVGRYAGLTILKSLHKFYTKKTTSIAPDIIQAKFGYIVLCRAIPFFPAKQTSVALGILKYNIFLFFISSFIGIWIRGIIMFFILYYF